MQHDLQPASLRSRYSRLHCVLVWRYMGDLGMSGFKGTPGPWVAVQHYSDELSVIDSRGFEIVNAEAMPILLDYRNKLGIEHWADSTDGFLELENAEQDANAKLIAAAPELLEALQEIWDSCCTNAASKPSKKALLMAHAAINKALGE